MDIINEAADKFKDKQSELCEFLFKMLREINDLEREFVARSVKFQEKIPALNREQIHAEQTLFWRELRERYGKIVKDKCTEKLLSKPYGSSLYSGITYIFADEYFSDGTVTFKMKTPKRADIEVHYKRKTQDCANRFTLIKQDDKWLVDAHNWTSDYDNIWHRGHI